MKIHSLNCGTMCPTGARLIHGDGGYFERGMLVCHCLVVETSAGLLLVDTGFGLEDVANPRERLGGGFVAVGAPRLDPAETAARQVEQLGFSRADLRHIAVTHLDLDHAGGLADFPDAEVHVMAEEHDAAAARRTYIERERYRSAQWAHGAKFKLHVEGGEPWFGFSCVREVIPGEPDVLMVPLRGHTRGHAGVAVRGADGWRLHCGDAYFHRGEIDPREPPCPAGLTAYQRVIATDERARVANQARLRELVANHGGEVQVTCAHDLVMFERWSRTAVPKAAHETDAISA